MNVVSQRWRRAAVGTFVVVLAAAVGLVAPTDASAATKGGKQSGTTTTVAAPTKHSNIWEW